MKELLSVANMAWQETPNKLDYRDVLLFDALTRWLIKNNFNNRIIRFEALATAFEESIDEFGVVQLATFIEKWSVL